MKFVVRKTRESIVNLGRKLGYRFLSNNEGELSFVKPLGGRGYPRFHLFIKEQSDKISFGLHLDQKRSSYPGSSAHGGEYEGKLVEKESQRIKNILKKEALK